MGKLYFFYGAMNSGKTTKIIQVDYNYKEKGMKVVLMKPFIDTKGEKKVISRVGISRDVDYLIKVDDNLYDIYNENYYATNLVLVDEAQFLKRRQVNQLMDIATIYDVPVMCYGLRTDFMGNGFEGSTRLLEIAHELVENKTICSCGSKAMFNIRYVNGEIAKEGNSVAIDGKDEVTYDTGCAKCFIKRLGKRFDNKKD